jgi:WD40 repeat protein
LLYLPVSISISSSTESTAKTSADEDTGVFVSGAADASITVWSAQSGRRIAGTKGEATRGILALASPDLASNPHDIPSSSAITSGESTLKKDTRSGWDIYAGTSLNTIVSYSLTVPPSSASTVQKPTLTPHPKVQAFKIHETSVTALLFTPPENEDTVSPDLWSASIDKALHLSTYSEKSASYEPSQSFVHSSPVSAIAISSLEDGIVVTGTRDGEVYVWEITSGKVLHVFDQGHWDEVSSLLTFADDSGIVVSTSLDGTIRRWDCSRSAVLRAAAEKKKLAEEKEAGVEPVEAVKPGKVEDKKGESLLTAEEEAELAELMDED